MRFIPVRADQNLKRRITKLACGCLLSFLALAVLVMILFPTACGCTGREGARDAACVSNEKQLGLGLVQYAQDYDGYFPTGIHGKGYGWAGQVQGYIKSTGVFKCPDDTTSPTDTNPSLPGHAVSYAMNRNLSRRRARINQLSDSSKTVMLFEVQGVVAQIDKPDEGKHKGATSFSAVGDGTGGSLIAGKAQALYSTGWMGHRPVQQKGIQFGDSSGRHSGGSNFLFGDGHAKYLMPGSVSSGSDATKPSDPQTGAVFGKAAGVANDTYSATFSAR